MGEKIVIQPVTRIEGHAKVTIQLDDSGNVQDTWVNVIELRGFEKFCIGKPVEELPRIVTSICGVCPWSHHLASAKACDAVFGAEIPPTAKKLRELCNSIAYTEEHILHFYFLSGADFVMGPDAEYSVRNVIGIAEKLPDVAKTVVRCRKLGGKMLEIVSGKAIHPVTAVPGGFSKPLTPEERDQLKPMAQEILELAKFSIDYAKKSVFPQYLDAVKTLGVIETGFLGTVKEDGALDLYDGILRMMTSDGQFEEFTYDQYTDHIAEHVESWTYLKFPYMKKAGRFSMDLEEPSGIFRVNSLARLNVCDYIPTPLAQKEFEEFRNSFGRPAQLTLLYHWARLIELLYNAEKVVELLDDPEITGTDIWNGVTPRAARGVGCVEAPRGTLIHDYETDGDGIVTNMNLIVATTHNNAPINMSVKQAAKAVIKDGKYDEGTLNMVEMAIRAYDPCLSCATHNIDGSLPVKIDIVDKDMNRVDSLANF
ncbi:MAG: Ni/Fe hydrogenase subunit alpha [Deltaproteobacteria bacterium]|nr:Ni/Fe hydrogenase subunit alpha [Deltaproteobacteria bacterium]NIS77534.1 Ni/Fe hydrogenase subunit alpha [Deltaproteobacteria bacterium]